MSRPQNLEQALSQGSEPAREFYKKLVPFTRTEYGVFKSAARLKMQIEEQMPLICELAEVGLLEVTVELSPTVNDEQYQQLLKDIPC